MDTISIKNRKILMSDKNFTIKFGLFVIENGVAPTRIPEDCSIAGVYLSLMPNQRIELRQIDGD